MKMLIATMFKEGADANGPAEAEYLQTLRRGSTH